MRKIILTAFILPSIALSQNIIMKSGFHVSKYESLKSAYESDKLLNTHDYDSFIDYYFNIKKNSVSEIRAYRKDSNLYDTHLKSSLNEIKISINYSKPHALTNIIGYAPIGSYHNGWTGVTTIFESNELGVCSYSVEKFIAIEANIYAMSESVNNKPTFTSIKGNTEKGYIYTVKWDDDLKDSVIDHRIECVSKKLSDNTIDKMIILANNIDK